MYNDNSDKKKHSIDRQTQMTEITLEMTQHCQRWKYSQKVDKKEKVDKQLTK